MSKTKTGMVWEADLAGEDGNAWVIMGVTSRIIKQTLGKDEVSKYTKRAMSGDYENLLAVTREYVTIKQTGYWHEDDEEDVVEDGTEAEAIKVGAMGVAITTLINSLPEPQKADLIEVLRATLEGSDD